jgi:uncharacterized membrane protein YcjF (UPF0283 family)
MLPEQVREQFKKDVAQMKLSTGASRYDSVIRYAGLLLMIGGAAAAFILYEASLSESDARNIASQQVLAIGFLAVTMIGVALFVVASLGRLLRLWLLRQLYEGQAHVDQLAAAVRPAAPAPEVASEVQAAAASTTGNSSG